MKRDPVILLKVKDSDKYEENYHLASGLVAASAALATPGSIEGFEALNTDKRLDLLRVTQKLGYRHSFVSSTIVDESVATKVMPDLDASQILGITESSTIFCEYAGGSYVVVECHRCGAYCQGIVDSDGCDCCRDEEDPGTHTCDCLEGDGFEAAIMCVIHNACHVNDSGHSQPDHQSYWATTASTGGIVMQDLINAVVGSKRFARLSNSKQDPGTD